MGAAGHSRNLRDRENPEEFHVSDGNLEIYSKGPTDEGNAVLFYDDDFANEEQVRFSALWSRGAHIDELDEPKRKVLHEDAAIPDTYLDEVEDGL